MRENFIKSLVVGRSPFLVSTRTQPVYEGGDIKVLKSGERSKLIERSISPSWRNGSL